MLGGFRVFGLCGDPAIIIIWSACTTQIFFKIVKSQPMILYNGTCGGEAVGISNNSSV